MDIYPNMTVKEPEFEDANGIQKWNRFKEDFLQNENYYRNHFSLPDHTIEFLEDIFDIALREKCPNTDLFLFRIFLYSD